MYPWRYVNQRNPEGGDYVNRGETEGVDFWDFWDFWDILD